jgi:hypothetical protein
MVADQDGPRQLSRLHDVDGSCQSSLGQVGQTFYQGWWFDHDGWGRPAFAFIKPGNHTDLRLHSPVDLGHLYIHLGSQPYLRPRYVHVLLPGSLALTDLGHLHINCGLFLPSLRDGHFHVLFPLGLLDLLLNDFYFPILIVLDEAALYLAHVAGETGGCLTIRKLCAWDNILVKASLAVFAGVSGQPEFTFFNHSILRLLMFPSSAWVDLPLDWLGPRLWLGQDHFARLGLGRCLHLTRSSLGSRLLLRLGLTRNLGLRH